MPIMDEIDETQELYYPAIMKAIVKTGYKGYVAQEFLPTGKTDNDKEQALEKAVQLCDVWEKWGKKIGRINKYHFKIKQRSMILCEMEDIKCNF